MILEVENNPDTSRKPAVKILLESHWGSSFVASKGKLTDASNIPRVIALDDNNIMGLATYAIDSKKLSCEIVSLNAVERGKGIGSALIKEVENQARLAGCAKVWLITTNANPEAAAFYVIQGYLLVAIHRDALEISRKLKPQIPTVDDRGIPLLDEWEFSKQLSTTNEA